MGDSDIRGTSWRLIESQHGEDKVIYLVTVSGGKPLRGHWPAKEVVIREAECLPLLYKQGFWLKVEALFQHGASS